MIMVAGEALRAVGALAGRIPHLLTQLRLRIPIDHLPMLTRPPGGN